MRCSCVFFGDACGQLCLESIHHFCGQKNGMRIQSFKLATQAQKGVVCFEHQLRFFHLLRTFFTIIFTGANGFHCCFVQFTPKNTWMFHDVSWLQMVFTTVFSSKNPCVPFKKEPLQPISANPWITGTTLYLQIHHAIGPVPEIKTMGSLVTLHETNSSHMKIDSSKVGRQFFFGKKFLSNSRV